MQIEGEFLSSDDASANKMKQKLFDIMENKPYLTDNVYNVGEIGLNWKSLMQKFLVSRRKYAAVGFKVGMKWVSHGLCKC